MKVGGAIRTRSEREAVIELQVRKAASLSSSSDVFAKLELCERPVGGIMDIYIATIVFWGSDELPQCCIKDPIHTMIFPA